MTATDVFAILFIVVKQTLQYHNIMEYTHKIHKTDLGCHLDLNIIAAESSDAVFKQRPFRVLIWKNQTIGKTCLVYESGKLTCHGDYHHLKKYCDLIEKMGFPIKSNNIQLMTSSGVYELTGPIDYTKLVQLVPGVCYEPELYHAPNFKRGKINFTVYCSGKVVITGITSEEQVETVVMPTLMEVEILMNT